MGQVASAVATISNVPTRPTITTHVFINLDGLVPRRVPNPATDAARARAVVRRVGALRAALPGAVPHMVASRAMHASLQRVAPEAPFLARVHVTAPGESRESPGGALLRRYLNALADDARAGTMAAIVVAQDDVDDASHLARAIRYHTPDARLAAGRLLYARVMEDDAAVVVEDASRFPLAFERRSELDAFTAALRRLGRREARPSRR